MVNRMTTDLAVGQSVVLVGPGAVKVHAANSVTLSKVTGAKAVGGSAGSSASLAKLGSALHVTGPLLGFALLSFGTLLLVRHWLAKVERGECS